MLIPAFLVLLTWMLHASASPTAEPRQATSLSDFIAQERPIALEGALSNIGGLNSSWVEGASPGVIVASPSTVNPNYFYTWTRDSALTYMMLIDELIFGNRSLQKTIEDYTNAQAILQTVTNPSGSLWPAGDGLGEAKYYTNLTRFDGTWGRPQRDGPALRAIAFMTLAPVLIGLNETEEYKEIYWPLVLNDLKYVGQYWNQVSSGWIVGNDHTNSNNRQATTFGKKSMVHPSSPWPYSIGLLFKVRSWLQSWKKNAAHVNRHPKCCASSNTITGMKVVAI